MTPGVADLPRERRRLRVAGAAGLGSVVLAFGAILLAARASTPGGGEGPGRARQLLDLQAHGELQWAAVGARGLGMVLLVLLGLRIDEAIRARSTEMPRFARTLAVAGPLLVAVATAAAFVALAAVAADFAAFGPRTEARAEDLVAADGALRAGFVLERIAFFAFGIWITIVSLMGMRCGLFTRFLGIWGIGAGIVGTLLPVGSALVIGWVGSVALLALGWWPGGRPPAWDAGRAVPWTPPGLEGPRVSEGPVRA